MGPITGEGKIIRVNVISKKNRIKVILDDKIVKEKTFIVYRSGQGICVKSLGPDYKQVI